MPPTAAKPQTPKTATAAHGDRSCLACRQPEPIATAEPFWPPSWQCRDPPLYTTSFVVLAFPAMATLRVIERRQRDVTLQTLPDSEFRISGLTNGVLAAAARAEQGLRRLGVPMPFGGSQVLVAERPR